MLAGDGQIEDPALVARAPMLRPAMEWFERVGSGVEQQVEHHGQVGVPGTQAAGCHRRRGTAREPRPRSRAPTADPVVHQVELDVVARHSVVERPDQVPAREAVRSSVEPDRRGGESNPSVASMASMASVDWSGGSVIVSAPSVTNGWSRSRPCEMPT